MDPRIKSILVDKIASDWKKLAHEAVFSEATIDSIDLGKNCDQCKMEELLRLLVLRNHSDFMSVIKTSLTLMGRADILNEIQMIYASDQLKAYYRNTYGTCRHKQSQRNDPNPVVNNLKLALVEDSDLKAVTDDFNEWEYFCHKQNTYKEIKCEEVFDRTSRLILISGPKGIGKTNFLQNCLYQWSNGLHWKDLNFVFYFEFNRFNKLQNVSNMKQLIKKFYKNILKGYNLSSFNATMFIIDGLDEFVYIEQLINRKPSNTIPIISALEDVFSSETYKCVISGNVSVAMRYWSTIKDYKGALIMQVMGFNISGTKSFLEDLLGSKTLKADIKKLYTLSRNEAAMLSVSLYLKAVSSMLLTLNIQYVKTMTELHALLFLHFVQQNCKTKEPLLQLMRIYQHHILKVCEVAFVLLDKGKSNISLSEVGLVLDENGFEPLGFIKKSIVSQQYEFVHLVLMKFCASVHVLFSVSCHEIIKNERLRYCLPFIGGLVHCNERSFLNLIFKLKEPLHKPAFWLRDIWEHSDHELFIECFYEAQVSINEDLKNTIENQNSWIKMTEEGNAADQISKQEYFRDKLREAGIKINYIKCLKYKASVKNELLSNSSSLENLDDKKRHVNPEKIFREVKIMPKEVLGENHTDTLNKKCRIAICFYKNKQFDKAEKNTERYRNYAKRGFRREACTYTKYSISDSKMLL